MAEVSFPLPRAGYEALVRIIRGYFGIGAGGEPVPLSSVVAATDMRKPHISVNHKFFVSMEILERADKGYRLTSDGLQLAQVLDHFEENILAPEVHSAWGSIVDKNDFIQQVMTAVRVRGNMDTEAFARHIALTSGAPNKPQYMTGARTVITILKAANKLVEDEDGVLRVVDTKPTTKDIMVGPPTAEKQQVVPSLSPQVQPSTLEPKISLMAMIQITPTTTDDELVELARKVKYLARLINNGDRMQDDDAEIS